MIIRFILSPLKWRDRYEDRCRRCRRRFAAGWCTSYNKTKMMKFCIKFLKSKDNAIKKNNNNSSADKERFIEISMRNTLNLTSRALTQQRCIPTTTLILTVYYCLISSLFPSHKYLSKAEKTHIIRYEPYFVHNIYRTH